MDLSAAKATQGARRRAGSTAEVADRVSVSVCRFFGKSREKARRVATHPFSQLSAFSFQLYLQCFGSNRGGAEVAEGIAEEMG